MATNFITNSKEHKTLKGRLRKLIGMSGELKFLVGFFYFSGWREVYESLQKHPDVQLKLLVGLKVDKMLGQLIEHDHPEDGLSQEDYFADFMASMGKAINNAEMDTEAFYNQVGFFIEMLQNGRLQIRKTRNPNHAKLYIFKIAGQFAELRSSVFATGSSNLTKAGLESQEEFNVEISDYGTDDAEAYFDTLWEDAIPITEDDVRRDQLIRFIRHRSQAATVDPFEAYALILKTFLELHEQKEIKPEVIRLLEENGYEKYRYQLDAVEQALTTIDAYNGVIIADVVGLGKSVIAAMIAKHLGKRGMVICPPGLIGNKRDNTGWWEYINGFKLYDWEIESRGSIVDLSESFARRERDIEVLIIDEAHYYRNQDTEAYEALMNICRGKTVILLTATPFNNAPDDIFSLLKLFIIPGKSGITIEDNLEGAFRAYNYRFQRLSYITKNWNSQDPDKAQRAANMYREMLGLEPPVDIDMVRVHTQILANTIKEVIAPVVIRRNRLDLLQDFEYKREITDLPEVQPPEELFFTLSPEQSAFYDAIVTEYFGESGRFTGAIYQPYLYEQPIDDEEALDEEGNRVFQQQRNLYDFMRRLLVKRFESSFGAFAKSIERFVKVHSIVLQFIENSGGKYILDRKLIESIYGNDEDEILTALEEFARALQDRSSPRHERIYEVDTFHRKQEFLTDIINDLALLREIHGQIVQLNLIVDDPKRKAVYERINKVLKKENGRRKVIVFSEYTDTVRHLEDYFNDKFSNRVLICDGSLTKKLTTALNANFNAQYKEQQLNDYDILLTSDKLSEGVNLNRAGYIINYDIPWNPTRVIQRVGRINRIGKKVFDELFIANFFPTETGADYVRSREIATQKMFLIHNALGEDARIFDPEEKPTASSLYRKISETPEEDEELSLITFIRNQYHLIQSEHPEVIEKITQLPARVKTAKAFKEDQVNVLRRKGLSLFAQQVTAPSSEKNQVNSMLIESLFPLVECQPEEQRMPLSENFWPAYETIKGYQPVHRSGRSEIALESKAHHNLKAALKFISPKHESLRPFIETLIKDIRKYHTLPKYTLRRLTKTKLTPDSGDKLKDQFYREVNWVRNHLGEDYLDRMLERVQDQELEVIIAVENRAKA